MPSYALPSLEDVEHAAHLISQKVLKTPVITSQTISKIVTAVLQANCAGATETNIELYFKCENLQHTGSFKFRGASHFLARLENHDLENGVVAYSTGTSPAQRKFVHI